MNRVRCLYELRPTLLGFQNFDTKNLYINFTCLLVFN
jgi:hypothetical protein